MENKSLNENLRKTLLGIIGIPGYLICWQLSYYWINNNTNLSLSFDYFRLAWTFSGGERPFFTWVFSIIIYVAVFVLAYIFGKLIRISASGR